jgi:hypothetical protein
MTRTTLFLAALITVAASGILFAQDTSTKSTDKGDQRVADQLNRLGLHYTLTKSGNYSVTFDLDSGRSQVAYVTARTETYGGMEIREVWSRAGTMNDVRSADVMQKLLEDSGTEKIGSWALEESSDGGYILYFSVRVPVDPKDSEMKALLEFTANVADKKELELFKVDDE